jgi:hypothetical protein
MVFCLSLNIFLKGLHCIILIVMNVLIFQLYIFNLVLF